MKLTTAYAVESAEHLQSFSQIQQDHETDMFRTNINTDRHTIVDMSLRTGRFVMVVALGLGATFAYATITTNKLTLRTIYSDDSDGYTSFDSHVTAQVALYNALFGSIMFAGGKIFEVYADKLIFPTLHTYLHNCPLYPGDQPQRVHSKVKDRSIFWALKAVIILMNVGFASLFVGQSMSENVSTSRRLTAESVSEVTTISAREDGQSSLLFDSILRTAWTGYTIPFEPIESSNCLDEDDIDSEISVEDVDTTTVAFGYPMRDWANAILPNDLAPSLTIQTNYEEYKQGPSVFTKQLEVAKQVEIEELYALLIQGLATLDRKVDQQSIWDNEIPLSLSADGLVEAVASGLNMTLSRQIDTSRLHLAVDHYELSEDIRFVALTIDVALMELDGVSTVCGVSRCVYASTSSSHIKPKISIMPYTKLSTRETEANAAFLYGIGQSFTTESGTSLSREYLSLSFGKLSWQLSKLHERHGVECAAEDDCLGLSVPFSNGDGVLLVGKDALPMNHVRSMLTLVTLNHMMIPHQGQDTFTTWHWMNQRSSDLVRQRDSSATPCNGLVDSYVSHLEANHLYLHNLVQTTWSSALLYLLQNGVSTAYINDAMAVSRRRLALAAGEASSTSEKKDIELAIPFTSSIATFVASGVMIVLMVFVIRFPTPRVKLSPDDTPAAQYVQILTDDLYPDVVHKKRLRFANGDALLFNEYVVNSIVLHAKRDQSKRIYL